jgi:hypothetical protein
MPEKDEYFLIREVPTLVAKAGGEMPAAVLTNNFLMVQAPGFIRGINRKSKIENPQAPVFIRGVNLKSKI